MEFMPTPWNHIFQLKWVLERISAAQFASIKQISCFDRSGFSTSHTIVSALASSIQSRPPLSFLCIVKLFPTHTFCWERADHSSEGWSGEQSSGGWELLSLAPFKPGSAHWMLMFIIWHVLKNCFKSCLEIFTFQSLHRWSQWFTFD